MSNRWRTKNSEPNVRADDRRTSRGHTLTWLVVAALAASIVTGAIVWVRQAGVVVVDSDDGDAALTAVGWIPPRFWFGSLDVFVAQLHRTVGAATLLLCAAWAVLAWRRRLGWTIGVLRVATATGVVAACIAGQHASAPDSYPWTAAHAALAPLAFGLAIAALAASRLRDTVYSRLLGDPKTDSLSYTFRRVVIATACVTTGCVFACVAAGAMLRHVPPSADAAWTLVLFRSHLILAAVLIPALGASFCVGLRSRRATASLLAPTVFLVAAACVQTALCGLSCAIQHGWTGLFLELLKPADYTRTCGSVSGVVTALGQTIGGSILVGASAWLLVTAWARPADR